MILIFCSNCARPYAINDKIPYASFTYIPQAISGYATIVFELMQQMGDVPGEVVVPVGKGSLILGNAKGFQAIQEIGNISRITRMVVVQSPAFASIWSVFH